jgi:uncharacterized HAD superfamily protein
MDKYEFKNRESLERYTREYLSTYFETTVSAGDVLPKDYKFGKLGTLSFEELYGVLNHYRNIINSKQKPKTNIKTIQNYYDPNRLTMHHTFDNVDTSNYIFWGFTIVILIIVFFIIYKRKKN